LGAAKPKRRLWRFQNINALGPEYGATLKSALADDKEALGRREREAGVDHGVRLRNGQHGVCWAVVAAATACERAREIGVRQDEIEIRMLEYAALMHA